MYDFCEINLIHTGLKSSYDNKRRKLNGSTAKQKQQTVSGHAEIKQVHAWLKLRLTVESQTLKAASPR